MRIAHLSDLHFTSFFKSNNLEQIKYLLKYALKQKADHIIITGDLTDNANHQDLLTLRKLFKDLGILHHDKLSLVIGNHDIFGGVQTAEDIFTFPERCRNIDYKKKVKEFYVCFKETFDGAVIIDHDSVFPYAKIINDVLLIGFNSNAEYSAAKNLFASNGAVHIDQFNKAVQILNSHAGKCKTKIVMIHHHFNKMKATRNKAFGSFWQSIEKQTMKLRKKKRLISMFKEYNIDLVLHGHYHEMKEYFRKGIRFLNAGAAIKGEKLNHININFIDIKYDGIKIKTESIHPSAADIAVDFYQRQRELKKDEETFISNLAIN